MSKDKKKKELYLKVPYHILNIPKLRPAEKVLLAHIYSFGAKGCWQSNKTLAEMFMTSVATIKRRLNSLRKYISIKNPKGYYRTIWAKSHPEVKKNVSRWLKSEPVVAQKCTFDRLKNELPLAQKCATTNNKTIKENYKRTPASSCPAASTCVERRRGRRKTGAGATPSPLPAGGQAPALLVEREKETDAEIQKFMKGFGRGSKKKFQPISEKEFQKRKEAQIKALLGEKNET